MNLMVGGNAGIGKETARDLAKRGARLILLCRNLSKANKAVHDIKSSSGNSSIEVEQLDLASLTSIRQCADALHKKLDRIDFLINNAGLVTI